jgi:hypothetical protein
MSQAASDKTAAAALLMPQSIPICRPAAELQARNVRRDTIERFPRKSAVFDPIDGVPTMNVPAAHMSWERREAGLARFFVARRRLWIERDALPSESR